MGDQAEFWRDMKDEQRVRKALREEENLRLLEASGIPFETNYKTRGHVVIRVGDVATYDFWMTTGRFIERKTKLGGYGAKRLIHRVRQDEKTLAR